MIRSYMQQNNVKCIVSNVVPDPVTSPLQIVQEFRADMNNAHIPIDTVALEAYIGARLFIDVLKHIQGPINKDSIRKALEGIKNYDFKGLHLNFDPETRQLSDTIWLDTGVGDWIVALGCKKVKEPKAHQPSQKQVEQASVQSGVLTIG